MKVTNLKVLVLALAAGSLPVALYRPPPAGDTPPPPATIELVMEGAPANQAQRLIAKEQVARDVVAGRLSLLQAAALFRELNKLIPRPAKPTVVDTSIDIPADTDEAWLCRQVVYHVRVALTTDPLRARAAVSRLEADFAAELRQCGAIRLPDASALPPVRQLLGQGRDLRTAARTPAAADSRGTGGQPRAFADPADRGR